MKAIRELYGITSEDGLFDASCSFVTIVNRLFLSRVDDSGRR